jgi:hypothetical protein
MNSFIHFGCWNDGLCDINTNNNALSSVIKSIEKAKPPSFYIVAGDNYYPKKDKDKEKDKEKDKDKKSKTPRLFVENEFDSGFNCLDSIQKKAPMYLLMGNHDLKYEKNLISDNSTKLDKCHIIKKQITKDFDTQSYAHLMSNHTICLFINTVLYTDDRNESKDCISIYRNVKLNTIEQYQNVDETVLVEILKTISRYHKLKNIIIVGHDPIVTRRLKKDKDKREPLHCDGLEFLNKLYNIVPSANKYYLCADTHNYQEATIMLRNHQIQQYVVGTGGTDLDREYIPNDNSLISLQNNYNGLFYKLNLINISHGYLLCNEDSNGTLTFTFNAVHTQNKGKGTIKKVKKKDNTRRTKRNRK